jgi:hypothetical protein
MEVTARGDATYRVFSDYDKASIAIPAEELCTLFDYMLQHIGEIQVEAITQRQRETQPQAQTSKGKKA